LLIAVWKVAFGEIPVAGSDGRFTNCCGTKNLFVIINSFLLVGGIFHPPPLRINLQ